MLKKSRLEYLSLFIKINFKFFYKLINDMVIKNECGTVPDPLYAVHA